MSRSYHGTGEQAIEWLLNVNTDNDLYNNEAFLKAWQEDSAEDEWPDFYKWLDGQTPATKLGSGSPDAAIAIGEHAFRAGYKSAAAMYGSGDSIVEYDAANAWSAYDPPEHIKDLA